MNQVKFLTAFCAVFFLNGLFGNSVFGQQTESPKPAEVKAEVKTANAQEKIVQEKVVAAADADAEISAKRQGNEKYRIGFQDTLEISVFRHPELSQVVNVSPDGTILMPKISNPIVAVCKTERELGATVGTLYKNYLRNPFVQVRAVEQRSQPFAVIGAVEKPGSFYLNRRIRLLELLAFAGGQKVEKAGSKIQVARIGNVAGCAENSESSENDDIVFLSYKLKEVLSGQENPYMEPGDIVSVLEAEEAYVVGNVIKPTKVSLKETVTLTQAIAIAGGLAPEAKISKVVVQRQQSDSPLKTETVYDLKDIIARKIPDPVLQANDIVNVPKDGAKSVRNQILKAFTGGIGNIFYRIPLP